MAIVFTPLLQQYGLIAVFFLSLAFNASIFFPLPADIVVFTAGGMFAEMGLFGPLLVAVFAAIAAGIGELTAFGVGRGASVVALRKKHKHFERAEDFFNKYGALGIIFFSFTPLPMDLMGLLAGALFYDVKKFLVAAWVGKLIRCLILAFAGYYGVGAVLSILSL